MEKFKFLKNQKNFGAEFLARQVNDLNLASKHKKKLRPNYPKM